MNLDKNYVDFLRDENAIMYKEIVRASVYTNFA